jgi:hypothetical protein
VTLNSEVSISDDGLSYASDNATTRMEEGSTEQFFKDVMMPDGDACRPDGTLKDASEMEWPNSPSEETRNLPELTQLSEDGYNLKRSLPCDEEESNSESDGPPKTKVNYISIVFTDLEHLLKLWDPAKIESSS